MMRIGALTLTLLIIIILITGYKKFELTTKYYIENQETETRIDTVSISYCKFLKREIKPGIDIEPKSLRVKYSTQVDIEIRDTLNRNITLESFSYREL